MHIHLPRPASLTQKTSQRANKQVVLFQQFPRAVRLPGHLLKQGHKQNTVHNMHCFALQLMMSAACHSNKDC